jgi:DNA-binding NarL/FixJ family response regulator
MSDPAGPVRVVLADDHPVVRRGLAALLSSVDGIEVVGQASSGLEAVREAQLLAPDVVLMDVRMPDLDGVEASRRIAATSPDVAVLVLTMHDDDETVFAALRAGARGYVLKDSGREGLLRAIRAVAGGEAIFSPSIAGRVLDFFARRRPSVAPEDFPMLTARERDVLHLIAQGRSNPQISAQLGLSPKTTSNYVSAILTKLQVRDRAEAAVRARGATPGSGGG